MAPPSRRPLLVFLSYATEDQDFAKTLIRRLVKPGALEPWDPAENLLPGDNVGAKRGAALASADAIVLLVSPDAMRSEWVTSDISFALGSPGLKDRVFPILIRATPEIPWILKTTLIAIRATDPSAAATVLSPRLRRLPPRADVPARISRESRTGAEREPALKDLLEAYERWLIESALAHSAGDTRRAAASLGLLPTTLREKMKRLRVRDAEPESGAPILNVLDPVRQRS